MKLIAKPFLSKISILALSLLVGGCLNNDMTDLTNYVKEVKSRKQGDIEPLPEIKQIETFTYAAAGRRSPFVPEERQDEPTVANEGNGLMPDPNRRKEELEGYELDSLRMVGTLEQLAETWALVRTQENTIYRVKSGNYLGKNHGQITQIAESKIELTEIIPDGQGGYRERQASLALSE
jgi:type IV pilus assembly protein PilP